MGYFNIKLNYYYLILNNYQKKTNKNASMYINHFFN